MLFTKKTMPIFKGVNLKEKINALLSDCCFNVEQNTTPHIYCRGKSNSSKARSQVCKAWKKLRNLQLSLIYHLSLTNCLRLYFFITNRNCGPNVMNELYNTYDKLNKK